MQDNAAIYTAKIVTKQLENNGVQLYEYPPNSLDLNPIEHCQNQIKTWLRQNKPELLLNRKSDKAFKRLEKAIYEAQEELPDSIVKSLTSSMPDRVQAVINANGWHTRY